MAQPPHCVRSVYLRHPWYVPALFALLACGPAEQSSDSGAAEGGTITGTGDTASGQGGGDGGTDSAAGGTSARNSASEFNEGGNDSDSSSTGPKGGSSTQVSRTSGGASSKDSSSSSSSALGGTPSAGGSSSRPTSNAGGSSSGGSSSRSGFGSSSSATSGGKSAAGGSVAAGGVAVGGASASSATSAACPYTGHVTYTLAKASSPTTQQQAAYTKITAAMDTAVRYYNCYTDITKELRISYEPSVATADGNINGSIRFGSDASMNKVTAMHEIGHTVGIGTAPKWSSLVVNKEFTGANAKAELQKISLFASSDGIVHADTQHFWPGGLNYESEGKTEADLIAHCQMVVAIRKDLGLQ